MVMQLCKKYDMSRAYTINSKAVIIARLAERPQPSWFFNWHAVAKRGDMDKAHISFCLKEAVCL